MNIYIYDNGEKKGRWRLILMVSLITDFDTKR